MDDIAERVSRLIPRPRDERFNKELFRGGALEPVVENMVQVRGGLIHELEQTYSQPTESDENFMAKRVHSMVAEVVWQEAFTGKVPAGWVSPERVNEDLLKANAERISLKHDLLLAGLTHPDSHVAVKFGTTQKLTSEELSWYLARTDVLEGDKKKVVEAQELRGLRPKDIQAAQKQAELQRAAHSLLERGISPDFDRATMAEAYPAVADFVSGFRFRRTAENFGYAGLTRSLDANPFLRRQMNSHSQLPSR